MKNIYIIPTDKPSKLFFNKIENKFIIDNHFEDTIKESWFQDYNMYIISDEKIKEGDWYATFILDPNTKWETRKFSYVVKADLNKTNDYLIEPFSKYCKKVILTTDENLIKDGIQEIDDDFLNWFVNNSNCEFVEVYGVNGNLFAEPIISQEESEQEPLSFPVFNNEKSKEITKEYQKLVIAGASWQQERIYTEEDLFNFAIFCSNNHSLDDSDKDNICWQPIFKDSIKLTMKEMFEQFKKTIKYEQ